MNDPLQKLLEINSKANLFPPNSRYHGTETDVLETADGRKVMFIRRRFLPARGQFAVIQEHTIVEGDRLDSLAARFLGDPEAFWRLCDANGAMIPEELTGEVGRVLRITLPEGIPGTGNA